MFIATYIFKEKVKVAFNDVRNAVANLNTFVQEHITGMNVVHIFGREKNEFERFKELNKEHRSAHLRSVLYYSVYFPVAEIIAAMGIGLLVWYGAKNALRFEEHFCLPPVGVLRCLSFFGDPPMYPLHRLRHELLSKQFCLLW